MITDELLAILVCPKCKGPLAYQMNAPQLFDCAKCRLRYPVKDEIPVLLIEEAKSY